MGEAPIIICQDLQHGNDNDFESNGDKKYVIGGTAGEFFLCEQMSWGMG